MTHVYVTNLKMGVPPIYGTFRGKILGKHGSCRMLRVYPTLRTNLRDISMAFVLLLGQVVAPITLRESYMASWEITHNWKFLGKHHWLVVGPPL